MKSDKFLAQLVNLRVIEWHSRDRRKETRPGPVVTITREPGCGGESISEKLSAELKLHLYHWEVVEQIAKDTHFSTKIVSTLDEKTRSELEEWLGDFRGNSNLSSYTYVKALKRVLFAIAAHGSAIILGRGSNFVLPSDKRIGLCFVAPLDVRIKNVIKELGCSEKHAQEHIVKLQTEYQKYVKKYFNADIHDPTRFHLVVNTALVQPESIVRIVKGIIDDTTQAQGTLNHTKPDTLEHH